VCVPATRGVPAARRRREVFDGDVLRLDLPRPEPVVEEALVHGPEPALADEVAAREPARRRLELRQRERVQPRRRQRPRQVVQRQRAKPRRRAAHAPHRLLRLPLGPAVAAASLRHRRRIPEEAPEQHPHLNSPAMVLATAKLPLPADAFVSR
jgi:hypothetical protein